MKKVIIGMSGGVDSSVAALLLKEKGYAVIGITLKLWDDASRCCNYEDVLSAKKACYKLGIRHYVINAKRDFKKHVVDYFADEYIAGRTPNPCAVCNDAIKFRYLLKKMRELDFDCVATGHYARILKKGRAYYPAAAADKSKSQEYFLARLDEDELKHIIFPLGGLRKKQVKEIAEKNGIKPNRGESQEVCFLKDDETPYEFIKRYKGNDAPEGGEICCEDGSKLADSKAAYYKYTVGQRKGLGISSPNPLYVTAIDAERKKIYVAGREKLNRREFTARGMKYFGPVKKSFRAGVKVRYLHKAAKASVKTDGTRVFVVFDEPQFAVTPGQLAVFYSGNRVIGSGYIENTGS